MNSTDFNGLIKVIKAYGLVPQPYANNNASLDEYAQFGVQFGIPECPYNLSKIECDGNGRVVRL